MIELEERICELETWTEGKGLIVQGAAGTFCSGSDLNAVRAISNPQVLTIQDVISWFLVYHGKLWSYSMVLNYLV